MKEVVPLNYENVKDTMKGIYRKVLDRDIDDAVFDPGDDLIHTLFIDSLLALQMLILMEQEFSIVIEDDALAIELLNDINKACNYILSVTS